MQTYIPKICSISLLTNVCSCIMITMQRTNVRNKCSAPDYRIVITNDKKTGGTVMRENRRMRARKEAQQKRIVVLFCSIIAVVMIATVFLRSTSAQAAPAEVTYKYYTSIQVESGDTLWDIASEYVSDEYSDVHEYMNEVCTINHISEDEIHAGQYIVVPYFSSEAAQ